VSIIKGMKDKKPQGTEESVLHKGNERQKAPGGPKRVSFIKGMKDKNPQGTEESVLHKGNERQQTSGEQSAVFHLRKLRYNI